MAIWRYVNKEKTRSSIQNSIFLETRESGLVDFNMLRHAAWYLTSHPEPLGNNIYTLLILYTSTPNT